MKSQFVGKKKQKQPSDWEFGEPKLSNIHFRHNKYIGLECKGTISPEKLLSSEKAAYYHGLRNHYQIMLWSFIDIFELEATDWGWKLDDEVITSVMTDKEIAPESLTKVIRCNCKVCMCEIQNILSAVVWKK